MSVHEGLRHIKCQHCEKDFNNRSGLSLHVKKHHKDMYRDKEPKVYTCVSCTEVFTSKTMLKEHSAEVHGSDLIYKCDRCDKKYSSDHYLKTHVENVHEGRKNFGCDLCGKTFTTLSSLKGG